MNKKIEQYLQAHPFFKTRKEDGDEYRYFFSNEKEAWTLCVLKHYSMEESDFPTYPMDANKSLTTTYWSLPDWLKKIETTVNDMVFESIRLKMVLENKKIPYHNLIFFHTYFEEEGGAFWDLFTGEDMERKGYITMKQTFLPVVERLMPKLEENGYKASITLINETDMTFEIKENSEYQPKRKQG